MKMTKDLTTAFLQIPGQRTRVPSYRVRELARGQFMIESKSITLLDCIGEGINNIQKAALNRTFHLFINTGEFGIVYKAKLRSSNKEVAVKTLKG